MNIAFVSGSIEEAKFLSLIAKSLKEKSIESYFVYTRKHIYDFFEKKGDANLFFQDRLDNITHEQIFEYLSEYKDSNLSLLVYSDPVLCKTSFERGIKVVISYLKFWERFIQKKNVQAIIHYPTASVVGRSAYLAAKKFGVKHLVFQTGPIVNENFTICDINEEWIWSEFLNDYGNEDIVLDEDIGAKVNTLVDKVIETKNRSIKIRKVALKSFISFLYSSIKYKKYDKIEINEFRKLFFCFLRKIPLKAFRYDFPDKRDKYLFFPLHISWDAQIATRNPMFSEQLYLVKMLSKSLPYGYYLYVKEHPYNYGGERIKLLKSIKGFRNVKLLHPETSSIDLIRYASAVVTINSTAGLEAIILKKALITFGRTFYSHFKYCYAINHMGRLPDIVNEVLFSNHDEFTQQPEYLREWQKFLWLVLSTSHNGAAVSYKNYMGLGTNVFDENIRNTAESIYSKLNM